MEELYAEGVAIHGGPESLGRARTTDQSDRAGLDPVLRGVLPLRTVSAPGTHQRLPDALDPQEIQTTETLHKALACWRRITRQYPRLFAHWARVRVAW